MTSIARTLGLALIALTAWSTLVTPGTGHAASLPAHCRLAPTRVASAPAFPVVAMAGDTLVVEGTSGPDHIAIKEGRNAAEVRVVFNGKNLGAFGPAARIAVRAGGGNDIVIVDWRVALPARLEGGEGDDCLRGGAGADQLLGGPGHDVLIGSLGRDALQSRPGRDRVVISQPMGAIRVGPSATGDSLRVMGTGYRRYALSTRGSSGPVVLGAADLDDATTADLARHSYQDGHAVALTNATTSDAARLSALLGHRGAATWGPAHPRMDLVALRKVVRPDGATHFSTDLVAPRRVAPGPAGRLKEGRPRADMGILEALTHIFAETPVLPDPPSGDDPPNLMQIADSYQTKGIGADDSTGNIIQLVNNVWAARSFQNTFDLYYVFQELDTTLGAGDVRGWQNVVGTQPGPASGVTAVQTSPDSTMTTTTVTSGVSQNYGGNVGFDKSALPSVTGSAGVTISNSKTSIVPPIQVANEEDPQTGVTGWLFFVNQLPDLGEAISTYQQWIWEVDFSAYGGATTFPYAAGASMVIDYRDNPAYELDTPQINATVPLPFGRVFQLEKPVVRAVSPTCANAGTSFTIQGTSLYPALVTSVLIDGMPLDSSQYTPVGNNAISVIAPEVSGEALPVVVQTTMGESNSDVTIEISVIDICNLARGAPPGGGPA